jgi:hypothetical protein
MNFLHGRKLSFPFFLQFSFAVRVSSSFAPDFSTVKPLRKPLFVQGGNIRSTTKSGLFTQWFENGSDRLYVSDPRIYENIIHYISWVT